KNISLNFHMVGHLQTNKVNKALDIFSLIHSVDSFRLLQKINEVSASKGNITEVLLEVNVSGEKSKFGINSSEAIDFLKEASGLDGICVRGLMTVAPLVKNKDDARPYFSKLRQLKDKIREMGEPFFKGRVKMDFLSMGMSQDYEAAIQEGSNMLRIGSAIFEGE
ncbi:MAG: YggS family pyridoxal phosphate-dependent enzyme, partial [Candidatus Omnitrophica bacterium]|nr:YggS family pyridoxal phosphate-dependent enzyme [Candidatus Omnitrophota bacterium]